MGKVFNKKRISLLVFIIFLLFAFVGLFFTFNNYLYQKKQGDGKIIEPYQATLSGVYTCLPHKDTSGPQTLECALGMRTDAGEYYAIDFGLLSQTPPPNLVTGNRFSAHGVVTPVERLSSDQWQKYPIVAIFSITDSLQIIE